MGTDPSLWRDCGRLEGESPRRQRVSPQWLGFGLGVWGVGFGVWGVGIRVWDVGLKVYGLGLVFGVKGTSGRDCG